MRQDFMEGQYMSKAIREDYFFYMGEKQRKLALEWANDQRWSGGSSFLYTIRQVPYLVQNDYWIATIEPSITEDGHIFYQKEQKVLCGLTIEEWHQKAKEYCSARNSKIATIYETFLWYAWRGANSYWNLQYLCKDSSSKGNWRDSPDTAGHIELTGAREVGGFCDGTGNTCKLVTESRKTISIGGAWYMSGKIEPVTIRRSIISKQYPLPDTSGIISMH